MTVSEGWPIIALAAVLLFLIGLVLKYSDFSQLIESTFADDQEKTYYGLWPLRSRKSRDGLRGKKE